VQPSSTSPGKLVVAHAERHAQRTLQRLVGATSCPVQIVADGAALAATVDAETIAVVDAAIAHATPGLGDRPARAWIAVPGEGLAPADSATVATLLARGWSHVIAHPMPILAEELLATVQKVLRDDVFGLEKYIAWGADVRSYVLEDACERSDAVAALAGDVTALGLPERVGSLVSVIADELIANALYVAPIDERKQRHRVNEARDHHRALHGRDVVTVRWATDARYLAIEVRDRWGTLAPDRVAGRLATGKTHAAHATPGASATPGEAGMGLALAYACCNQLVIDLEPEVMTEVIALVDVRYKPTDLGRSASFHTFVASGLEEGWRSASRDAAS
jgi:hypothetical protein